MHTEEVQDYRKTDHRPRLDPDGDHAVIPGLPFSLRSNGDPHLRYFCQKQLAPGKPGDQLYFSMIFRRSFSNPAKKQLTLISGPAVSDRVEDRIRTGDLQSHNLAL